jgi:hypothetical protein
MLFGSDGNNNMLRDVTRVKRGDTVGLIEPIGSVPTWIGMFLLGWFVFTSLVFQQIREDIIVADILKGRRFRCKSIVILLEKEDLLKTRAQEFRQFLEAMKTWGGMDIITIKPGEEPTVKSMGDGYVTT